jgi:hypothetical protein
MNMKSQMSRKSGVALVLVLGFLVIITALAVAFFSSVTTELRASRNFQGNVNTRQLQEAVVNLVEGQIRQATSVSVSDNTTQNVAWASQPGMISTFGDGNGNAASTALANYKLYSSAIMTLKAGSANPPLTWPNAGTAPATTTPPPAPTGDLAPAGWETTPAIWTDLNAPVLVQDPSNPTGSPLPRFPIIDPRAYVTAGPPAYGSGVASATSGPLVEGFSYTAPSGWKSSDVVIDNTATPGTNNDARLAMPVQWMYILKDGTLITPASGSGVQATFSSTALTNTNPIVGRVAFWTDDDTSKLNINTAGGTYYTTKETANLNNYSSTQYAGSYWDTPRVVSLFDEGQVYQPGVTSPAYAAGGSGNGGTPLPPIGTYGGGGGLAAVQMIQNEFQRYPGHPAQTSLAMIFRNILTPEQFYLATPRLVANGESVGGIVANTTQGGTYRLHISPPVGATAVPGAATYGVTPNTALPIRYDRLYDSVDELLFAFNTGSTAGSGPRKANTQMMTGLTVQPPGYPSPAYSTGNVNDLTQFTPGLLDQLRFFLTAYNRAPELNLLGHPRVCVWPVRSQTNQEDNTAGTAGNGSGGAPLSTQTSTGINAYDALSLFCSTIGTTFVPYSGNNSDAASQTQPSSASSPPFHYSFFRREITGTTAPVPAQGTSKPVTDIYLGRNQQLMTYLQSQVSQKIPGFGQSFVSGTKYTQADMNETLVEMFDYIRCANLYDSTQIINGPPNNPSYYNPHPFSSTGIVMPSVCNYLTSGQTQNGMGRFPTICEATLIFYYAGSNITYTTNPTNPTVYPVPAGVTGVQEFSEKSGVLVIVPPMTPYAITTSPTKVTQIPNTRYMRAALIFSTFNPMQGYGPIAPPTIVNGQPTSPLVSLVVSGHSGFTIAGGNTPGGVSGSPFPITSTSPDPATINLGTVSGSFWGGRNFGGFEGFQHTLFNAITFNVANNVPIAGLNAGAPIQGLYPLSTPVGSKMSVAVGPLNFPAGPAGIAPVDSHGNPTNVICDYQEAAIPTFMLNGALVTVAVNYGGQTIQTIKIQFPVGPVALPAPRGDDIIDAEPFMIQTPATLTPVLAGTPTKMPILANSSVAVAGLVAPALDANLANPVSASNYTQGGPQTYGQLRRWYWSQDLGSFDPNANRICPAQTATSRPTSYNNFTGVDARTVAHARDFQSRINWVLNGNVAFQSTSASNGSENPYSPTVGTAQNWYGGRWRQIVQPGDTVRSMIFCNLLPATSGSSPTTYTGDLRLATLTNTIAAPATQGTASNPTIAPGFYPHPDYVSGNNSTTPGSSPATMHQACLLRMADGELYYNYAADNFFNLTANSTAQGWGPVGYSAITPAQNYPWFSNQSPFGNHVALTAAKSSLLNNQVFPASFAVANLPRILGGSVASKTIPYCVNGVLQQNGTNGAYGDFDTGVGGYADGPYFNKQDEGNATFVYIDELTGQTYYPIPYFGSGSYSPPGSAFNSPNRQMPSAAMMGSLLSQAATGIGWQTLCFCPNPASNATSPKVTHRGLIAPNDELLLDLFQMPVVQPYPISEPFSTAGKVNLNYQIQPFNYILRSTALRAVLESERVSIIGSATPTTLTALTQGGAAVSGATMFAQYKAQPTTSGQPGLPQEMTNNIRYVIDRDQTVNEIGAYIAQNGPFKSPAQICEIYLVPYGAGWTVATSATTSFTTAANAAQLQWTNNGDLTGDNLREKPYVDIYPRLTTKSNTYTIHMRVQALQQQPHPTASAYLTWDESKDTVLGEYRGSATIERYIDPSDPAFTGKGNNPSVVNANAYIGSGASWVNPDVTTPANSLEPLYRFRTVNTKKFSP